VVPGDEGDARARAAGVGQLAGSDRLAADPQRELRVLGLPQLDPGVGELPRRVVAARQPRLFDPRRLERVAAKRDRLKLLLAVPAGARRAGRSQRERQLRVEQDGERTLERSRGAAFAALFFKLWVGST